MVEVKLIIDGFNESCKNFAASFLKVRDKSMSATRFWMMAKGNLLNLSHIFRKPETLGTEFKTVAYSVTGNLIFVEVQG